MFCYLGRRGSSSSPFPAPSLSWNSILEERNDDAVLPRIIDADLAALIYTSGSTGLPKGIACTHHNVVSAARSIIQYIENDKNDVILDVLPLAFDYGLYQIVMAFMFGGTVVLERSVAYLEPLLRDNRKGEGYRLSHSSNNQRTAAPDETLSF